MHATALARTTDPHSSHSAAHGMAESGKLKTHRHLVQCFLLERPGSTARELADAISRSGWLYESHRKALDYHEVMRRLNDVADKGPARVCSVKPGRPVCTWFARAV